MNIKNMMLNVKSLALIAIGIGALLAIFNAAHLHRIGLTTAIASNQHQVRFYRYASSSLQSTKHEHKPERDVAAASGDAVLLFLSGKSVEDDAVKKLHVAEYNKQNQLWKTIIPNWNKAANKSPQFFSKNYREDLNSVPFSQGLCFSDHDKMIQSAGLYNGSILREFDTNTGLTLRYLRLPDHLFGEGCTMIKVYEKAQERDLRSSAPVGRHEPRSSRHADEGKLFILQLTWKEHLLIVYDYDTLRPIASLKVPFTGWGLVSNFDIECHLHGGKYCNTAVGVINTQSKLQLWATSGGSTLYELDASQIEGLIQQYINGKGGSAKPEPEKVAILKRTDIKCLGQQLRAANELEFDPKQRSIYANIFGTFIVAEIDPLSGSCKSLTSFSGIHDPASHSNDLQNDVMNGIALVRTGDAKSTQGALPKFYLTGKRWPKAYIADLVDITPSTPVHSAAVLKTLLPEFSSYR